MELGFVSKRTCVSAAKEKKQTVAWSSVAIDGQSCFAQSCWNFNGDVVSTLAVDVVAASIIGTSGSA